MECCDILSGQDEEDGNHMYSCSEGSIKRILRGKICSAPKYDHACKNVTSRFCSDIWSETLNQGEAVWLSGDGIGLQITTLPWFKQQPSPPTHLSHKMVGSVPGPLGGTKTEAVAFLQL